MYTPFMAFYSFYHEHGYIVNDMEPNELHQPLIVFFFRF